MDARGVGNVDAALLEIEEVLGMRYCDPSQMTAVALRNPVDEDDERFLCRDATLAPVLRIDRRARNLAKHLGVGAGWPTLPHSEPVVQSATVRQRLEDMRGGQPKAVSLPVLYGPSPANAHPAPSRGVRALLPVARSRSSGPLGGLLSPPALDVRLMTALQVLQVLLGGKASVLARERAGDEGAFVLLACE